MFLLLFSFLVSAQECPKMWGQKQDIGWAFYPIEMEGTIPVPAEALGEGCSIDASVLEMNEGEISVSEEKLLQKELRDQLDNLEKNRIKALKDKVKIQKLSEYEKDELLKVLVEGK